MASQLPAFLIATTWPYPYGYVHYDLSQYAFDFYQRVQWPTADNLKWRQLAMPRLARAVQRVGVMQTALIDYMGQPHVLVDKIQMLGELLLDGESKMPFLRLGDLAEIIEEDHSSLIESQYEKTPASKVVLQKLVEVIKATKVKEVAGKDEEASEPVESRLVAPKRGQIGKARGDASFVSLVATYGSVLQSLGAPGRDVQAIIAAAFQASTVLPKAALLRCKKAKMGPYVEVEFLMALQEFTTPANKKKPGNADICQDFSHHG